MTQTMYAYMNKRRKKIKSVYKNIRGCLHQIRMKNTLLGIRMCEVQW
jgi:hypothetical protein